MRKTALSLSPMQKKKRNKVEQPKTQIFVPQIFAEILHGLAVRGRIGWALK
jgi:hypothetical protein